MTTTAPKVAPFKRTLKRGDIGPDVLAVKRALVAADYLGYGPKEEITRQFGEKMYTALRAFQKAKALQVDGIYGIASHRKLMPFFDSHGCWLMGRAPLPQSPALTPRQKVVNEATWGYNNRGSIHYRQFRPMQTLNMGHRLPQSLDCSEFSTVSYKRSDCPDPNGPSFGYNGLGYTGTLAVHGQLVSTNQARPADLVLYGGGYPYEHVAVYVGFGRVISHGSEAGPLLLPMDYRSDRRQIRSYLL